MTPQLPQLLLAAFVAQAAARLGAPRKPFAVQLWKEHARNLDGANETEPVTDHGRGYFVGAIKLGGPVPQELRMIFSTTSGMVSVPSSNCASAACTEHHQYAPRKSSTSVDINRDGRPVDPWGGRVAPEGLRRDSASLGFYTTNSDENTTGLDGVFVSERVCLGDLLGSTDPNPRPVCTQVSMIVATRIQESTFRSRPEDGMVGLSLKGLSIEPHFNILDRMSADGLQSQFGFFVEDDARNAELVFGGFDGGRLEEGLSWVPVAAPSMGHWLVNIISVHIGSKRLDMCNRADPCRGMIDTSSPGITMPEHLINSEMKDLLGMADGKDGPGPEAKSCSLPDLSLELEGGVTLTLRVEDYAGPKCEPEIRPHSFGSDIVGAQLFLLGEPVLRRYYTVFDWGRQRLGFGKAKVERSCQRLSAAWLPTDSYSCSGPTDGLSDSIVLLSDREDYELTKHMET